MLYVLFCALCSLKWKRLNALQQIYVLAHSIAVEETMFVVTIVLMNLAHTLATAHQVNIVVIENVP